ncbi:PDZ domain-containing protein [Stieleria marina]
MARLSLARPFFAQARATRFYSAPFYSARSIVLVALAGAFVSLGDSPDANGQLFRRLRQRVQAAAPQPQYRPQYRPQVPAQTQQPGATGLRAGTRSTGDTTNRSNSPVIVIDPRTGRRVLVQPRPAAAANSASDSARANASATETNKPSSDGKTAPSDGSGPSQTKRFGESILRSNSPGNQSASTSNNQPAKSTLGIRVAPASGIGAGLNVISIRSESKADDAGLKVGDRILFFNGQPTPDVQSLSQFITRLPPGQIVTLRVGRGGRIGDIRVPLTAAPIARTTSPSSSNADPRVVQNQTGQSRSNLRNETSADQSPDKRTSAKHPSDNGVRLGIDIEDQPGSRGVIVLSVDPNSPAAMAGLQRGDRIVSIDGRMVVGTDAFARELSGRSPQLPMAVQLVRQNQLRASTISFQTPAKSTSPDNAASTNGLATGQSPTNSQNANTKKSGNSILQPSESKPDDSKNAGSVLGGVGSMLGGLFGGNSASTGNQPDGNAATAPTSDPSSLPATDAGEKAATSDSANTDVIDPVNGVVDEMALDDDEPINQAIFAQPVDTLQIPERKFDAPNQRNRAKLDPPSAAKITPPAKAEQKATPAPTDATAQKISELQAEVERLKKLIEPNKAK